MQYQIDGLPTGSLFKCRRRYMPCSSVFHIGLFIFAAIDCISADAGTALGALIFSVWALHQQRAHGIPSGMIFFSLRIVSSRKALRSPQIHILVLQTERPNH